MRIIILDFSGVSWSKWSPRLFHTDMNTNSKREFGMKHDFVQVYQHLQSWNISISNGIQKPISVAHANAPKKHSWIVSLHMSNCCMREESIKQESNQENVSIPGLLGLVSLGGEEGARLLGPWGAAFSQSALARSLRDTPLCAIKSVSQACFSNTSWPVINFFKSTTCDSTRGLQMQGGTHQDVASLRLPLR